MEGGFISRNETERYLKHWLFDFSWKGREDVWGGGGGGGGVGVGAVVKATVARKREIKYLEKPRVDTP